jgi:hypothetical protein
MWAELAVWTGGGRDVLCLQPVGKADVLSSSAHAYHSLKLQEWPIKNNSKIFLKKYISLKDVI